MQVFALPTLLVAFGLTSVFEGCAVTLGDGGLVGSDIVGGSCSDSDPCGTGLLCGSNDICFEEAPGDIACSGDGDCTTAGDYCDTGAGFCSWAA